jgi:hypothetical protein
MRVLEVLETEDTLVSSTKLVWLSKAMIVKTRPIISHKLIGKFNTKPDPSALVFISRNGQNSTLNPETRSYRYISPPDQTLHNTKRLLYVSK